MKIISTTSSSYIAYTRKVFSNGRGKYNGAYFYSKEIVKNIIPRIKTTRSWDTLGMRAVGSTEHAIVFIHHCINWDRVYGWLDRYKDHIYVVSTKPTFEWFVERGKKAILLPLSIDVDYVRQFKTEKTKKACYAGNRWKFKRDDEEKNIPSGVDFPPNNIPRDELLKFISQYKELYAIGRCALEGMVLGCEIKAFYHVYPDPSYWKVLDNKDAAALLQQALDMVEADGHSVDCFELPEYRYAKKVCKIPGVK